MREILQTRGEYGNFNPTYTGFVNDITPEQLGFNYYKVCPPKKFRSQGDGVGYTRKRSLMDQFSVIDERLLTRRPGVPAEKITQQFTLSAFSVRRRHLDGISVEDTNRQLRAYHPDASDPAFDEVAAVRETMLLAKEVRFSAFLKDDNNYGGVTTSVGDWADPNYDVRREILAGPLAVKRQGGLRANVAVLPYDVAMALALNESIWKLNSALKDRSLDEDTLATTLARAFKLDKVIILTAQYSATGLNAYGDVNLTEIYSDFAIFYYEPQGGPDFNKRCWALEAVDTFYSDTLETTVDTWFDNDREATINRVKEDSDFNVMDKVNAFKINDVLKS